MAAEVVVLSVSQVCEDCGAELAAGTQARAYRTKAGAMKYYCLDGHQSQARGGAAGRPTGRGNFPKRAGGPAPAYAPAQGQPSGASNEQVQTYARLMVTTVGGLGRQLEELTEAVRGIREAVEALVAASISERGGRQ